MRVVGIDLGTSNTVVASAEGPRGGAIELVSLAQRTSADAFERSVLFPSCALAPLPGELSASPEWPEPEGWTLGAYAKRRGVELPGRLVASSKSWLSHPRVDKRSAILPWGADDETPRLSPVDVATLLLGQVRTHWDKDHPDAPLSGATVVLTVPASFDEIARELTVEATTRAGLSVRLLEEPQAAFYAAMHRSGLTPLLEDMERTGREVARVLVCDVGGGTTDLSLLEVRRSPLSVERVAVGSHLLLGGDNMDLALAHELEPALAGPGQKLDALQWNALVLACQKAKERLLSDDPPEELPITLLGRGSQLLGSVKRARLTREEVERVVLSGFFPEVARGETHKRARTGLVAMGLPYERDVAITRHVAAFLDRHLPSVDGAPAPAIDAVLFNGGVFRATAIAKRLLACLEAWHGRAPIVIDAADPDTAVAIGAVVFGRAIAGDGLRIGGGAPRSYFLGLGGAPQGAPLAVCVIPKGAAEGVPLHLSQPALKLLVGKPARFSVFTTDAPTRFVPGQIVSVAAHDLDELPPLHTAIPSSSTGQSELDVRLEAELTALGTLDVACVEHRSVEHDTSALKPARYRLSFDLGGEAKDTTETRRAGRARPLDEALDRVTAIYGKGTTSEAKDAKNLLRDLERMLGAKDEWSADDNRALADRLLSHVKGRRRSADHERVYFQLTGFCLRPGVGAPGDEARCAVLAPLFGDRLGFGKESRGWQQFFICFRRIAAGLSEQAQLTVVAELAPFVAPSELKLKRPKSWKPESSDYEILELMSHLERLPSTRRVQVGDWILERTWTKRDPRLWASLGRIGARVPAYASAHHVVPVNVAERWIDHLLRDDWGDLASAPRAAVELARATGDRARDVTPDVRESVVKRLVREGAAEDLVRVVREVVPIVEKDRAQFFGEHLPAGLRLSPATDPSS